MNICYNVVHVLSCLLTIWEGGGEGVGVRGGGGGVLGVALH